MFRLPRTLCLIALVGACNEAPGEPVISLSPETPRTLDDLVLSVDQDAPDKNKNDVVTYRTTWRQDGERRDDLANVTEVQSTQTRKGETWTVSVSASDGKEIGAPVELSVLIENTPPTATVELTPSTARTDAKLRTTVTKQDVDIDPITVRYQWTLNGSVVSETSQDIQPERTTKGDVWEISVFPSDDEVEGEPAVASVVIQNTPPQVLTATVRPTNPSKADTLTCHGTGFTDLDDDPEGYRVEWLVNGSVASPDPELSGDLLTRGDEVICRLTAFDGEDLGNTVQSSPVRVINTPPSVDSVSIGPEDPTKDDIVFATPGATSDADGDEVTFFHEWVVAGRISATTPELPASRFRKGDTIQLRLVPYDGIQRGEPVSSNTLIGGNNLPTLDLLSLSATTLYSDTALEAITSTTDPDGDVVSVDYAWYVNGSLVAETSSLLDGTTWFDRGDTVYVTATPNDGDGTGDSLTSSTLTCVNSPPEAPEVSITPSRPEVGDDLVCSLDTASYDADGDEITYRLTWERNGTGWGGSTSTTTISGDTIRADDIADGDSWQCSLAPSDGFTTGVAGTDSVRVGGVNTLIIYDTTGSSTPDLEKALEDAGHTVTLSSTAETSYNGSNPSLTGYDVVIHLNGTTYGTDMPVAGQKAIEAFVDAGGGFIHSEWNAYEVGLGRMATLASLTPLRRTSGTTATGASFKAVGTHPVTANVGTSFTTSYSCGLSVGNKISGTVIMTEGTNDAVVVDTYGKGRIVAFHNAGNYTATCLNDTNLLQLYVDAVSWAAGG